MNARGNNWLNLTVIFPLMMLLPCCEKPDAPSLSKESAQPDSARSNVSDLMLDTPTEIEQSLNRILKLIKEKEIELNKAQQEINRQSAELKAREQQLAKLEIEMKKLRNRSYLVLGVGLVLILIGLYLLFSRSKAEAH